jgi:hypothetical protein
VESKGISTASFSTQAKTYSPLIQLLLIFGISNIINNGVQRKTPLPCGRGLVGCWYSVCCSVCGNILLDFGCEVVIVYLILFIVRSNKENIEKRALTFNYGGVKVRGVNLGGWLLTERKQLQLTLISFHISLT